MPIVPSDSLRYEFHILRRTFNDLSKPPTIVNEQAGDAAPVVKTL